MRQMDKLTPEFFDALVMINLALGIIWAGRRFWKDIRRSAPDDEMKQGEH